MIVLDTNVLSEALKPVPSAAVLRWLSEQEPLTAFTTTITQAEVLYRIEMLPPGKRRAQLAAAMDHLFAEEFQDRILHFDEDAARAFAKIVAGRDAAGRPISQFDAMIAAIARSRSAEVATRNARDFYGCGVHIINPWTD